MQVRLTTDSPRRKPTGRTRAGSSESGLGASSAGSTSAAAPVEAVRSPFLQILDEILPVHQTGTADLHTLWKQLPELERELMDHPSNANLARYKELVIAIARETLRKNTRVKKIRRKNRKGEMIELSVVEFIDDRLQKMAHMMTAPGNSAYFMLKTVEEIRGALLDVRE
ncbi:MAG: YaaR family protein [bacterium]|nr:YaaR family protein [bacterium]